MAALVASHLPQSLVFRDDSEEPLLGHCDVFFQFNDDIWSLLKRVYAEAVRELFFDCRIQAAESFLLVIGHSAISALIVVHD